MHLRLTPCRNEAMESEWALLRGDSDKLNAGTALVFGGILASVLWTAIALLAWVTIA